MTATTLKDYIFGNGFDAGIAMFDEDLDCYSLIDFDEFKLTVESHLNEEYNCFDEEFQLSKYNERRDYLDEYIEEFKADCDSYELMSRLYEYYVDLREDSAYAKLKEAALDERYELELIVNASNTEILSSVRL